MLLFLSLLTFPDAFFGHVIRHKDVLGTINGVPKAKLKQRRLMKSGGIVGILTLPVSKVLRNKIHQNIFESHSETKIITELNELERMSFFPSSYAKWLRRHNVQIVPIDIYSSDDDLRLIMQSVDGVLLTGGAVPLIHSDTKIRIDDSFSNIGRVTELSFYTRKIRQIVTIAKELNGQRNNRYPIWGTCLGFEGLILAEAGLDVRFSDIDNNNFNTRLHLTEQGTQSNFVSFFPQKTIDAVQKDPIFFFNHDHAFFLSEFEKNEALSREYKVVATATTKYDKYPEPIVAVIENRNFPFYGVQFHPEKNAFESKVNADRSKATLQIMDKIAEFFCEKLDTVEDDSRLVEVEQRLQPYSVYVGSNIGVFDEVYIFQKDAVSPKDTN